MRDGRIYGVSRNNLSMLQGTGYEDLVSFGAMRQAVRLRNVVVVNEDGSLDHDAVLVVNTDGTVGVDEAK